MAKSGITLTEITHLGRNGVKLAAVALVSLIVGRMLWGAFIAYWRATHPTPPPPPTVGFGILPQIRFPEVALNDKPDSYQLELPTGSFPQFSDRAEVFFMPQTTLSLLADERARQVASQYDFVFEPEKLSSRIYRWRRSTPLESTLQLDIQTLQLKFSTNYLSRSELLLQSQLPDPLAAEQIVKNFLDQGELLARDLASSSAKTTYMKALGTELVEAVSYSDADFIQVDLNRYPIRGNHEMYTPLGEQGVVRAIVGGSFSGVDNIYQLSYNYHPKDSSQVHTYPIRTPAAAWQVLQAGEGYVADRGERDTAIIRDVVLGYYDDFEEQEYLQPIYVFTSDDGFMGYVPAVDPAYLQTQTSEDAL